MLALHTPAHLSTGQLAAFVLAAMCDEGGEPTTMTQLRETLKGAAGASIHTTYSIFLKPSKSRPKALGWLSQGFDPKDARARPLRLTTKGRRIVDKMLRSMGTTAEVRPVDRPPH